MPNQDFTAAPTAILRAATEHLDPPFNVIDLDRARANLADLATRADGKPLRIATKSVRVKQLLIDALAHEAVCGLMASTLDEALWLHSEGVCDDILVAYPTVSRSALARLVQGETNARGVSALDAITLMVDCPAHLDLIAQALETAGADAGPDTGNSTVQVCLDIDCAYSFSGARFGALRSPVRTMSDAARLVSDIVRRDYIELVGIMGYESQIAGVGDAGATARAAVIRTMQRASRRDVAERRAAIVQGVEALLRAHDRPPLRFVNGGGTGSIESTAAEASVTEIAAGSGILSATLFDTYTGFKARPAQWFALPVTRRPAHNTVTVYGGGRIASGPAGPDRLPTPVFPPGLKFAKDEGPGEVQTPLLGSAANDLQVGDRVWFRHTKAGEGFEFTNSVHVFSGDSLIDIWPTYRGERIELS